jgi:putative PEP-CTERM system TPR-repeat lipoprotein
MKRKSFNRNAVLAAVMLGISSLSLTGCGQKTSEEHVLAARQFVEAKDNQSAIIEYKSAIQKDPEDPNARFELGQLYLQQKDFAAAEKELNRALDLGYEVSEVLPLITRAYQETNSEVALSEINHNVDGLTPVKRAEVTYYKLEALLRLEKTKEARVLLDDIAQIDTSSVYKGLSLALGKVLDDDYEGALQAINTLHQQAPLNKDVLMQQARLNMYLRNLDAAVTAYDAYLDVAPDDTETKFILTAILMDAKRFEDAAPLVDDLLEQSATNPLLNQFKGVIEAREGNFSVALKHLETAIQNGRNDPLARLLAGFSAYQLEDYAATTRHLSMIASDLPPSHAALRMLANSLLQQGKNEEATDILARVDGEAENDAMLFSKAGYQLLQSGNVVDAKAMIEKSVPIATSAEDLTRIGVLQLSINDAEGLVNLEAAVERAPELTMGQQTLANAYIATRQFDKALEVAENWQKAEPQNAQPWLVKGQVYIAQQNYVAAEAAIAKAEALDSKNLKAKIQRVSLAMVQEQPQQALEAINQALSIDATDQASLALLYIVQKQMGKANEAVNTIQEVVARNPDNDVPKVLLARATWPKNGLLMALN